MTRSLTFSLLLTVFISAINNGCAPVKAPPTSAPPTALTPGAQSSRVVQPDYAKWRAVVPGMTEAEVEKLLGAPIRSGDPDWYKADPFYKLRDGDSHTTYSYSNCYGEIRLASPSFVDRPYEFNVTYGCEDRKVTEKSDPFGGELSKDAKPTVPALFYPKTGEAFDHYPRFLDFRWRPASGEYPMTYEVQLNSQPEDGWSGPAVMTLRTAEPYLAFSWVGKNEGVWRVRGVNKNGSGQWSEERTFVFER